MNGICQARLRLVEADGALRLPRRYAQSMDGHASSQVTLPSVSLSKHTASSIEHDLEPYATLLRCPAEVPHFSANERLSSTVIAFKRVFRSMTDYHHTVSFFATPTGEFTKRWRSPDNLDMDKQEIRRANLRRFVAIRCDGNLSKLSRKLGYESNSYVNDLLRDGSTKSFGEKSSAKIETKLGLRSGQLDIQDSPLLFDETRRDRVDEEITNQISGLTKDEKAELVDVLRDIYRKRKKRRAV